MSETTNNMTLQISGELPYCVLGWRTPEDQIGPELVAVYGPVPTKQDAEALKAALEMACGPDPYFTISTIHPVHLGNAANPGAAH
jgi:hypothetical protein